MMPAAAEPGPIMIVRTRIPQAIMKGGAILRQPGACKLFAYLYADMTEEDLVGSAVRIETERLEIYDGVEGQKAHDTTRLRLYSDAVGVVLAALCGDDESEAYLAEVLSATRKLIAAERFGKPN